jgi:hypothetical protein
MLKAIYSVVLSLSGLALLSQEGLKPLGSNLNYIYKDIRHLTTEPVYTSPHKAKAVNLGLPFKEDFSYSPRYNYPSPDLWEKDSAVYVNSGFPIAPPSIGVATFDGLNKFGYPYLPDLVNINEPKSADTLISLPINLSTFTISTSTGTVNKIAVPGDSISLTFYYQARGNGDPPEVSDSLVVDMYQPLLDKWEMVWYKRGNTNSNINDTMFKRAYIPIKDTNYLKDGFRFRFRNKATTNGDYDHWHVDYIELDHHQFVKDTTEDDVAIVHLPGPYLKNYSAMPCNQYNPLEVAAKMSVRIRYNNLASTNIQSKLEALYNNTVVFTTTTTAGNISNFIQYGYYSLSHPNNANGGLLHMPKPDTLHPTCDSTDFVIRHVLNYSGSQYNYHNDTVLQNVYFRNYYAFDDGSAEAGYYVNGAGGKVAVKINVNVADTFKGVRMYFDPAGNVKAKSEFTIHVWNNNGGVPGSIVYKDTARVVKFFSKDFKGVPEYKLKTPQFLTPGTYFIGFQQGVAAGIPVGFDKNYDRRSYLYYDSGSGWTQSQIGGSILLRPLFGQDMAQPVGIHEYDGNDKRFLVYPNPNNGNFFIAAPIAIGAEVGTTSFSLCNAMGQVVKQQTMPAATYEVNAEDLGNGVYFLILIQNGKPVQHQKIIIQH